MQREQWNKNHCNAAHLIIKAITMDWHALSLGKVTIMRMRVHAKTEVLHFPECGNGL